MSWKHYYTGKNIVKWKKPGKKLEIFGETIKGKKIWFASVVTKKSIRTKEIGTKKEAREFASKYMEKY